MKKIRVDFVAHYSVVVAINECENVYDKAVELAESYVANSPSVRPSWEVEGDGVDDADADADVDVEEMAE